MRQQAKFLMHHADLAPERRQCRPFGLPDIGPQHRNHAACRPDGGLHEPKHRAFPRARRPKQPGETALPQRERDIAQGCLPRVTLGVWIGQPDAPESHHKACFAW